MSARPLRTVLVGFGSVAAGYADDPKTARHFPYATHAQVLTEHPDFEWGAVVDPSEAARTEARERWGVLHVGADLEAVGAVYDPEVAVVATPPDSRPDVLGAFPGLRAVLLEKPLAPTLSAGEELVARCARRDVLLQVNYWRRADQTFRRLAAGELATRIGPIQAGFGIYGGGLMNNGSHLIDFVRMLAGEVGAVRALGPGAFPDGEAQPIFALTLRSGPTVTFHPVDFRHYREVALDLWGDSGRIAILQEGLLIVHFPIRPHRAVSGADEIAHDEPDILPTTTGRAFFDAYSGLAGALRDGSPPCCSGEDALATARVVEAVLESVRLGGAAVDPWRETTPAGSAPHGR